MADVAFTRAAAKAGATTPLVWAEWTDSDLGEHRWSDRPIADPGEEKERRVLQWGRIRHALGDDRGQLAGSALTITCDDRDRAIRTLIATEATRYVMGQPVDVWATTREARSAGDDPMRIFRGRWQHPDFKARRLATLTAEDYLTILSDPAVMAREIPQRRLGFGAQDRSAGFGEPIIYGTVDGAGLPSPGAVPVIHIADIDIGGTLYRVLIIAGHACKSIVEIYSSGFAVQSGEFGDWIYAPGRTGWPYGQTYGGVTVGPSGSTYIDYTPSGGTARRYTAILVRANTVDPNDMHRITCDVQGIEDVGDGTGDLITDYFAAYLHFLQNFSGIGGHNWQTGAWLGTPQWPDGSDMIDEASFATAQTDSATRLGGGDSYQVRGVIGASGQRLSLQEWLARWNQSGDVRPYMWDGQYGIVMTNRAATASVTITEDDDLIEDPPRFVPDSSALLTHLDLEAVPHYALHSPSVVAALGGDKFPQADQPIALTYKRSLAANRDYDLEKRDEMMLWLCDQATAVNIHSEALHRRMHPPVMVPFSMALPGLHLRPGAYRNVTHREGATAPTTTLVQIEEIEFDLSACKVEVMARVVPTEAISGFTGDTMVFDPVDVTPTDPPADAPAEFFATFPTQTRDLGGLLYVDGLKSASAVAPRERRRVRLSAADYTGKTVTARVEVRTRDAATSVTPEIWDVTGTPALLTAGTASTSTTPAEQTIDLTADLPTTGTTVVELRLKGSNATNEIFGTGRIEIA